jgi:hypothetical protein
MALATTVPLRVGEKLQLKMTLPGTNQSARVSGEVCWSDDSGRVGIQFLQVAPEVTDLLRSWLFDRLQESLAEAVLASRDG